MLGALAHCSTRLTFRHLTSVQRSILYLCISSERGARKLTIASTSHSPLVLFFAKPKLTVTPFEVECKEICRLDIRYWYYIIPFYRQLCYRRNIGLRERDKWKGLCICAEITSFYTSMVSYG